VAKTKGSARCLGTGSMGRWDLVLYIFTYCLLEEKCSLLYRLNRGGMLRCTDENSDRTSPQVPFLLLHHLDTLQRMLMHIISTYSIPK
jgi:hypothetical protein